MTKQTAQEAWEQSPGYVYFIAAGDPAAAIKIGISTEVAFKRRFKTIQGSNHERLKCLGLIPFPTMNEAQHRENKLHEGFEQFRRRPKGAAGHEWFITDQEIFDYIDTNEDIISQPLELDITKPKDQTGPRSSGQYTDIDEFLDELQKNISMDDDERAKLKCFHDALVFPGNLQRRYAVEVYVDDYSDVLVLPGYTLMLDKTLQFRLSDEPGEIVALIHAKGTKKGRMEINLETHPKKTLIEEVIKQHKLDELDSYNPKRKYPSIRWNDWKEHIDEFLSAFDQIAEESWRSQE